MARARHLISPPLEVGAGADGGDAKAKALAASGGQLKGQHSGARLPHGEHCREPCAVQVAVGVRGEAEHGRGSGCAGPGWGNRGGAPRERGEATPVPGDLF